MSQLTETLSIEDGLQLLAECGQGRCSSHRRGQTIPGPQRCHWLTFMMYLACKHTCPPVLLSRILFTKFVSTQCNCALY